MEVLSTRWSAFVGDYVQYLGTIGIISAVATTIAHVSYYWIKGYTIDLAGLLSKVFTAGAVPIGVGLILCSTAMEHLAEIKYLEIYIFASGVCLIYVSWLILFPKRERSNDGRGGRQGA